MTKMVDEGIQSSVKSNVLTSKNTKTNGTKKSLSKNKSTYVPKKMISTDHKVVAKQQQERNEFLAVMNAIQNNLKQKVCYIK